MHFAPFLRHPENVASTALHIVAHPAWALEQPTFQSWQAYAPAGSDVRGIVRSFSGHWLGKQTWRELDRE